MANTKKDTQMTEAQKKMVEQTKVVKEEKVSKKRAIKDAMLALPRDRSRAWYMRRLAEQGYNEEQISKVV